MKLQTTYQTLLLAACLAASAAQAAEVAGVRIDDTVKVGGSELVLNGAGVRSKFFVKVYVGALYAAQKATTPAALYDSPQPRRMLLRLMRELEAKKLQEALDEGLRNNLSAAELAAARGPIEQLGKLFESIGKAREGDAITLDFSSQGVAIGFNNEPRGTVGNGDFAKMLLRVWLGDEPADAGLKKALLGG
ncbi:MAG: chalcone isomerase family protein [Azonexus sp.]|jgi:long-chain acyl-CoA synthetase|nr:chalcone isomerase family protein [Azonexus sp.]